MSGPAATADVDRRRPDDAGAQRGVYLAAVVLLLAGVAAWFNSFRGVFVYDDMTAIVGNPYIHRLWPLSDAMSLPMLQGSQTVARRPLLSLTFALNHALLGPEPWGYHLVNLAIHLAAGLLLLGIVRRTLCLEPLGARYAGSSAALALAAALLWTVHPLQTESVTYIAQRAESLMGMLYLLTLYCSLRGFLSSRPGGWYAAAVAACAAGMAVKEVMVTAPLVVLLYDGTFISGSVRAAWRRRRAFYGALGATWAVLVLLQVVGIGEASRDFTQRSPWAYLLTQPGVILHYLRLCFWPEPLAIDYNWPTARTAAAIVPAGGVVLLLLAITIWGLCRRAWYGFLGAWFFLTLAPSSSFAALGQNLVEHRMYLALAAVAVLCVVAGDEVLRRLLPSASMRRVAGGAFVLLLAGALGVATHARNRDYHSAITLWTDNVARRPASFVGYNNLGLAQAQAGRWPDAIRSYRRALSINPDYAEAHNNLGIALDNSGPQHEEAAMAEYRRALEIDRDFALAHYNLGQLLYDRGQWEAAIAHLRQAVFQMPRHADAQLLLGNALAQQGNFAEATEHLRRAVEIDPRRAPPHYNLATALNAQGQPAAAMAQLRQAVEIDRHFWQAQLLLGGLYLQAGDRQAAVRHLQQAVQLRPESAEARELLRRAQSD